MTRHRRQYFGFCFYCSCLMYVAIVNIMRFCDVRSFCSSSVNRILQSKRYNNIISNSRRRTSTTIFVNSTITKENAIQSDIRRPGVPKHVRSSFFPIYYNDVYEVILPPKHRFPMGKYRQVREAVQGFISSSLSSSLSSIDNRKRYNIDCEFRVSPLATISELSTTHSLDYINRVITGDLTESEIRNVGFPWSPSGVDRARSSVGGTIAAAVAVCQELVHRQSSNTTNSNQLYCWGAHTAGGTHHAFYDYGEGFCVFSDIAVAANVILERFPSFIKRILIIDLDVHQGNGNAVLFQGRDDVFTFSIHCSGNYFSDKQTSDLDIELPIDCNDETYLSTLRHWLRQIEKNAGQFDFIIYQAGVDILSHDRLGRMNVTASGIKRRNAMIYDFAANILKVPMVITMGGGYPKMESDWSHIIDAHANVYIQAFQFLMEKSQNE